MDKEKALVITSIANGAYSSSYSQLYMKKVCIPISNIALIEPFNFETVFGMVQMESCKDPDTKKAFEAYKKGDFLPACISLRNNIPSHVIYTLEDFEECVSKCYDSVE